MPRKLFRKYLPSADALRSSRIVAAFGSWLQHPNLWHLNRRSVPGAVAIGLFSGLVPGPLQILSAVLLAVPLRKNLPVAILATLYTNPFTIVPIYLLAYACGRLILTGDHDPGPVEAFHFDWANFVDSMRGLFDWMLLLGKPLGVGLVALGCTLALAGYVAARVGWRLYVIAAWRARARRRKSRM